MSESSPVPLLADYGAGVCRRRRILLESRAGPRGVPKPRGRGASMRGAASALSVVALVALLGTACTGVRVREFAHESYRAGPAGAPAAGTLAAPGPEVWEALLQVLAARGAAIERADPEGGSLHASWTWASAEEAAAAVDLGELRIVRTRTERRYRSWSPLDFRCNACVVRNGHVIDQHTEQLDARSLSLDPSRYHLDAHLVATLDADLAGSRLVLSLEVAPEPREPPELEARSTGRLEAGLLAEVQEWLDSPVTGLR